MEMEIRNTKFEFISNLPPAAKGEPRQGREADLLRA